MRARVLPVVAVLLAATTGPAPAVAGRDLKNPVVPRIVVRQVGTARAGGYATFEVRTENVGGSGSWTFTAGDGSGAWGVDDYGEDCGGHRPGFAHTSRLTHAYRYPGRWVVLVRFVPTCQGVEGPAIEGRGVITVGEGTVRSNGPEVPLPGRLPMDCSWVRDRADRPSRDARCHPEYGDEDGYVTRVAYSWGDGSKDTVFTFPLSECVDPPDHWPATYADDEGPVWGARHRFPRVGTYRVRVTVTSSGCDGKDRQTRTASVRVL
jgi:hypothetical protein